MEQLWDLDAQSSAMGLRREYVAIGGDLQVGSLLSQIVYWTRPRNGKTKLRVKRYGEHWIAKTRDEWMDECCLTLAAYKRAVVRLQKLGLIELRVMRFAGRPVTHIRLLAETLFTAMKRVAGAVKEALTGRKRTNRMGEKLPSVRQCWSETDQSFTKTTSSETTNIQKQRAVARPELVHNKSGQENQTKPVAKRERIESVEQRTAAEIAAAKLAVKQTTPARRHLAMLWYGVLSEVQGGRFQKPLGVKSYSQLKRFGKDVGEQAADVLEYAMRNWWAFAHKAKASAGLETCPADPDPGFLLKHEAVAVNLYLQSIAQPTAVLASPVLHGLPKAQGLDAEDQDTPYTPSDADLEAALASFRQF